MADGTGADFGFSGMDQIKVVAEYIASNGGVAEMSDLYAALEARLDGNTLSAQGKSSLRFFVNEVAVRDGFIEPHDRSRPGWRLTKAGYELAGHRQPAPPSTSATHPPSAERPIKEALIEVHAALKSHEAMLRQLLHETGHQLTEVEQQLRSL